jgi:hypothetical protein
MKKYKNLSLLCRKEKTTCFLRRHGEGKLHDTDEEAREYFVSYLVPKWSPYLQSGLVDKWEEDANYEME